MASLDATITTSLTVLNTITLDTVNSSGTSTGLHLGYDAASATYEIDGAVTVSVLTSGTASGSRLTSGPPAIRA